MSEEVKKKKTERKKKKTNKKENTEEQKTESTSIQQVIKVCGSDHYMNINELEMWELNPRYLEEEQKEKLDSSLKSLGLFRSLIVWKDINDENASPKIIGGNQRFSRLKELNNQGFAFVSGTEFLGNKVPVTIIECDEEKARLIALRDNNSDGEWDYGKLSEFLNDLDEMIDEGENKLDLALAGFDDDMLDDLLLYAEDPEIKIMAAATFDPEIDSEDYDPDNDNRNYYTEDENLSPEDFVDDKTKKQKLVSVVIGHVRGRLSYSTYEKLIQVLAKRAPDIENSKEGGLNVAFMKIIEQLADSITTEETLEEEI